MNFRDIQIGSFDVDRLILFASFEERCTRVAEQLWSGGFRGSVTVLFCDDLPSEPLAANLLKIRTIFGAKKVDCVPVSVEDSGNVVKAAMSLRQCERIVIDVSCFNRENLFPFLWSLRLGIENFPFLVFAYTPPMQYGSWLSRDYAKARNILGFGGGFRIVKSRLLICIVGYEVERALSVIRSVEPSEVILVIGSIPTKQEFVERNRSAVAQVMGSNDFNVRELDVTNLSACVSQLRMMVEALSVDASVHLAPLNNKISCLASYAVWLDRQDIRLWNAVPRTYNISSYSKGASEPRFCMVDWPKFGTRGVT